MNATFTSTLASAGALCALLLLVGLSLVLKGLALQPRALALRLVLGAAALALVLTAFLAAGGWLDRAILLVFAFLFAPPLLGVVVIRDNQVGVVIKKFARRSLPAGQFIALAGEAGYQADTLPPGVHVGYGFWQFRIAKVPVAVVPQGEIACIVAAAGAPIPSERLLAKIVACDNFQDARAFLTAGTYRINPALFTVITAETAHEHGMAPEQLLVTRIAPDMVGIVTTLDGRPIDGGDIAGGLIHDHDNFQNAQSFLSDGGRRGLQEQVLLSGAWNLNPWFVAVEQVPMLSIPIGSVGVVISFVGLAHEDVSGAAFMHGDLVNIGHKGVWVTPLYPGKHPVNTRVMRVELVPRRTSSSTGPTAPRRTTTTTSSARSPCARATASRSTSTSRR